MKQWIIRSITAITAGIASIAGIAGIAISTDSNVTSFSPDPAVDIMIPPELIEPTSEPTSESSAEQGSGQAAPLLNPVFLVPGIIGSGLLATATNFSAPQCQKSLMNFHDYRLWASATALRPPKSHQQCWVELMSPSWSPTKEEADKLTSHPPNWWNPFSQNPFLELFGLRGVRHQWGQYTHHTFRMSRNGTSSDDASESPGGWYYDRYGIVVKPDSSLKGVDYLDYVDGYGVSFLRYFHDIISSLRKHGYKDESNLQGFPYDWRLPLWQYPWSSLKYQIEKQNRLSGKKSFLVGHSMGTISLTYFLNVFVDKAWKDKHVEGLVLISSAHGGSAKPIRALLSGYDPVDFNLFRLIEISLMPNLLLKNLTRSMGSVLTLLPRPEVMGWDKPFVYIKNNNTTDAQLYDTPNNTMDVNGSKIYTLRNWTSLIDDPLLLRRIEASNYITEAIVKDPEVPTYCIWSVYDVKQTESSFVYQYQFNTDPVIIRDYGDGSLPQESLSFCTKWNSTVFSKAYRNIDHVYILRDSSVVQLVTKILLAQPIHPVGTTNTLVDS